jgi:hypothetical protein
MGCQARATPEGGWGPNPIFSCKGDAPPRLTKHLASFDLCHRGIVTDAPTPPTHIGRCRAWAGCIGRTSNNSSYAVRKRAAAIAHQPAFTHRIDTGALRAHEIFSCGLTGSLQGRFDPSGPRLQKTRRLSGTQTASSGPKLRRRGDQPGLLAGSKIRPPLGWRKRCQSRHKTARKTRRKTTPKPNVKTVLETDSVLCCAQHNTDKCPELVIKHWEGFASHHSARVTCVGLPMFLKRQPLTGS